MNMFDGKAMGDHFAPSKCHTRPLPAIAYMSFFEKPSISLNAISSDSSALSESARVGAGRLRHKDFHSLRPSRTQTVWSLPTAYKLSSIVRTLWMEPRLGPFIDLGIASSSSSSSPPSVEVTSPSTETHNMRSSPARLAPTVNVR